MENKITVIICALLFVLSFGSIAQAQSFKVTGKVTAAPNGEPLPGVNVSVKDTTTIGTSTDADGNYTLQVPADKNALIFSFVGFEQKTVVIGNRKVINVELKQATKQLKDLVVVGYGTQTKEDVSGSISSVSGEDIENSTDNSIEQTLQGRTSGVHITTGSGELGQGINVQIRGSASITAGNQPLYVVDGVPVSTESLFDTGGSPLATLDMNNIKSISVLKDASAAAIYGSRASNGVVIIETKSGQAGGTNFNVSYQVSASSPTNKLNLMNAKQYVDYFRQAAIGGGKYDYRIHPGKWSSQQDAINAYLDDYTTKMDRITSGNEWRGDNPQSFNWQDAMFQNKLSHNLQLSVSGGTDQTTFFAAGGYDDKNGMLRNNTYDKINGRLNLNHHATDKLDLGFRINVNRSLNDRAFDATSGFGTLVQSIAQAPISPIYADADPNQPGYQKGKKFNTNSLYANNLDHSDNTESRARIFHTLGNVTAEYKILSNLSFKSRFGFDLLTLNYEYYTQPHLSYFTGYQGTGSNSFEQRQNYTSDNVFTYQNTFAKNHDLKVVLGSSFNWAMHTMNYTAGHTFPSKDFTNIANAAVITGGSSRDHDFRFMSYFTRANYKYLDRYLFKVSARVDGSSRFGKNHRYGLFPAVSAGWILSDEEFMQDMEVVSNLKLRASYGITGNAEIGNYRSLGLYNGGSYAGTSELSPSQIANPDLKWEKTRQLDIGVDFGFFNQRVTGNVDYYYKKTSDLLLDVDVPATTGFSTQLRNVGKLENRGFEFLIETRNLTGPFTWSTNFNMSFNRNKITNLDGQIIKVQSYANRYVNQAREGEPIGVFYTNEYAGVNPQNGDALFYLNHTPTNSELKNGDAFKVDGRFGDRYVTTDSNIASRTVVGNPNPDFTGGFGNTFSYKGLSLNILFQFVYGNQIYNANYFSRASGLFYDNQVVNQLNAWKKAGDVTDVPEARLNFNNGISARSSMHLSDGSYMRLKNLSFSYELPHRLLTKLNVKQIKLFITATNLLTFTSYDGWDPEHSLNFAQSNLNIGNSFYTPPQARTISGGINLKF